MVPGPFGNVFKTYDADAYSPPRDNSMPDAKDPNLAIFELYLATAEKVSDRRAQANAWMLSVNSAIVALYGYLQTDKLAIPTGQKAIWLWAIPAAGVIVCAAWTVLLTSYRKLNRAKFVVLQESRRIWRYSLSRVSARCIRSIVGDHSHTSKQRSPAASFCSTWPC
jgi:hypothetical protein